MDITCKSWDELAGENARLKELLRWCWDQISNSYTVTKEGEGFELKRIIYYRSEAMQIEKLLEEK